MLYGKELWHYKDEIGKNLQISYNRVFNNGLVGSIFLNKVCVKYFDDEEKEVDVWNGDLEIYFDDGSEHESEIPIEKFIAAFKNKYELKHHDKELYLNLYIKDGDLYHNGILQDYREIIVAKEFWWQFDIEIDPDHLTLYLRNCMSKGGYQIICKEKVFYKILCDYFYCIYIVFMDGDYEKLELRRNNCNQIIDDDMDDIDNMEGHQFEYYCAELLTENGFEDVEVTKASGDQGADIIAVKNGVRYAIQCKNYSSPLGNTPIQEVNAAKSFYNCHVGVVMTNSTFTPSAIELAKATGTLLWDRKYILKLL